MAASSPYANAAVMVRKPVNSHAPIRRAGESVSRAISAETMKIPEPIIEPITSVVALVRPRPLTNSGDAELSVMPLAGEFTAVFYTILPVNEISRLSYHFCNLGGWAYIPDPQLPHCFAGDPKYIYPLAESSLKNCSTLFRGKVCSSLITATESAPASITERQLAHVIPPMATIGFRVASRAARINSSPTTGSGFIFVLVAKMGPTAM